MELSRLNMILAVLGRKAGISLINEDVYVNIVGGLRPEGTSTDLAVALAIFSAYKRLPCTKRTLAMGEIGLTGDLRSVQIAEKIVKEAARMGFQRIFLPKNYARRMTEFAEGIELLGVKCLADAIEVI